MRTVKPVRNSVDVNQLRFPFNLRVGMRVWNYLFFSPQTYVHNRDKGADWNRGAYLVNGLAHCGACHTSKNAFGADKAAALTGASLQGWFAPDLTGDRKSNLNVDIQGGVGQATIHLPSRVGVIAEAHGGIGSVNVSGLRRDGEDYVNDAYGKTPVTIHVQVHGGIGQVRLIEEN